MRFSPCLGGTHCSKEGSHCKSCGRSHQEIAETKALAMAITQFALKMDYENVEAFAQFVTDKAVNKVRLTRAMAEAGMTTLPK